MSFTHWAVRPVDLQEALLDVQPHIVHFIGHDAEDGIVYEDGRGQPVRLGEQVLERLFGLLRNDIRLVVLDACYSASQAEAIACSVDAVIGIPARVEEGSTRMFMVAFYQAIAFGMPVRTAFDLASNSLALEELLLSEMPALILRPGIDPETVTFALETARSPTSVRAGGTQGRLESSPSIAGYDTSHFFQDAGFRLGSAEEQDSFFCVPRAAPWQKIIQGGAYARIFIERPLEVEDVIEIRDAARRASPPTEVAFVIVDRPIDDPTWLQIATLRAKGFNVVPIPSSLILAAVTKGSAESILSKHLERFLGRHADPYNVRHPVFDVLNFFGREALAEELRHLLSAGQPLGLFGLRKMGKSSLLAYLRGRLPYPAALIDLQTGTALPGLYERILRAWEEDARVRFEIDLGLSETTIDAADPTSSFVKATRETLSKLTLRQPGGRLVILLDEIELLTPLADDHGEALSRYLSFSRAVRGLIQEELPLSLMIVGVDPSVSRLSRWGANGEQNPFFSFVQEIYLPPLLHADCIQMVRNIGRQVAISYGDAAAQRIAFESGGHPYLARQLGSLIYGKRRGRSGEVTLEEVGAAVETFLYDARHAAAINETGLWGELTRGPLWSDKAALANEAVLSLLARADGSLPASALLAEGEPAARRTALAALEQFHVIRKVEGSEAVKGSTYELSFGLFRAWIRQVGLGLGG